MSRSVLLYSSTLLAVIISLVLTACGGGNKTYSLTATALSPGSLSIGNSATSAVTLTPKGGYAGTITLSCNVTGNASPAPTCAVSPNSVKISASSSAPLLTVTSTTSNPSGAYVVTLSGQDTSGLGPSNGLQSLSLTLKFQHIVVIFQENRTPDNLFHDPNLIAAGADIASTGIDSNGNAIPLVPKPLGLHYDLSHSNASFNAMCDYQISTSTCKMDGANLIPVNCMGTSHCSPPNPQFAYVRPSDVQPYFTLAEQYTFGDRMFQTNQGPSFPAHQFLISGTSEPLTGSSLFAAENPSGGADPFYNTGCTAPAVETVALVDASGIETSNSPIYPCFEHPTLTDELDAVGVTWHYYTPTAGVIWTAPNAIEHMCGPNVPPPNATSCTAPDWVNNVILYTTANPAPILTDIAAGQLPHVSWVIPSFSNSDHSGADANVGGPSWVASVVNAIGSSPYWPNTAIIITWDDWGGWYDHVPPPKIVNDGISWGSGYVYGFRVPLIVVSPLAKPRYISHNVHDFGSILNFIEKTFDLPSLGFADANTPDDLSDCFNFSQPPNTFTPVNAKFKASFFLHDRRPPTGPDDD